MDDRHVPAPQPSADASGPAQPAPVRRAVQPTDASYDEVLNVELAALLADLRVSVTNYVSRRRAEGAPVERVLPEVRCLVREAESWERWIDPDDTLVSQAVRWSIEAYQAD